jgi:DNA-3-methyladenine glycosylase
MFGPPGHLYVYRSYGVHWCSNIVTGRDGFGSAVLLRALEPRFGIGRMCNRRGSGDSPRELRDLARGPGRLCAALAITDTHYGVDLTAPPLFVANPPGRFVRPAIRATPRIGIRQGADLEWRVCAAGNPHVSGPARLR